MSACDQVRREENSTLVDEEFTMFGRSEGRMGMEHGGMEHHHDPCMGMMWEKFDDKTKKMMMMRMLDEKIMMKEHWIQHLQFKVESMKMLKSMMEKM